MATLQLCSKQQKGHLPSHENSLQIYSRHKTQTIARPNSLLDFCLRQAQATAFSHIPCPAYSSQIINTFSMTTTLVCSTLHPFPCSACQACPFSADLSQSSQHCSPSGFTAPFIFNTLPRTIHLNCLFFTYAGKLQQTNNKLVGTNLFLKVSQSTFQGCMSALFAVRIKLMLITTPEKVKTFHKKASNFLKTSGKNNTLSTEQKGQVFKH